MTELASQSAQNGYRSRLKASQEEAHLQNIATKIDRNMQELRSQVESSPTARRRWVWELIQNAKDVHQDDKVQIQIDTDFKNQSLVFWHTGRPFTANNIRFLIEQISTKDRKKAEIDCRSTTGKFGTGFLATHLLSEVVSVQGVAKEEGLEYKQFQFQLDRSGGDLDEIAEAVESAKQSVANLDELPSYDDYNIANFNTAFTYSLPDEVSNDVAKAGIEDLKNCLPFVLGLVPEIQRVNLTFQSLQFTRSNDRPWKGPLPENCTLRLSATSVDDALFGDQVFELVTLENGLTSISIPVERTDSETTILPINSVTPRLFCDFPLVGTENFPFPAVINNPNFDPTDPRDGVFLTGEKRICARTANNRQIISEAVNLFLKFVDFAVQRGWKGVHNLAAIHDLRTELSWVDGEWYQENVLEPIRQKLIKANIVETADGHLAPMQNVDGSAVVWFPYASKKTLREQMWQLANSWFPNALPKLDQLDMWHKLTWKDCGQLTPKQFAQFVENCGSVEALKEKMPDSDCVVWLQNFYAMLEADEATYDSIINNHSVFPNQNGDFCKVAQLSNDAGDIDATLKDISALLDSDVRARLLHDGLELPASVDRTIDRNSVVRQISSFVLETANNREEAKSYREAFRVLLVWFRDNSSLAQDLFPALYESRHLLYNDDAIMENMDKADQLDQLLSESGVSSVEELKVLLSTTKPDSDGGSELLPITQDILASLGISSQDDWEAALQDKDFAAKFAHNSVPTAAMFDFAQELIAAAKQQVIEHLRTLSNYDMSNVEETAPTVLGGIMKDDREIQVVARPGKSGVVIIYYSAERDTLDFVDSELWVDTGVEVRKVTLGHILKTTGIKKFPI